MNEKCPVTELGRVIDALLSSVIVQEPTRKALEALRHILTRFEHNKDMSVTLEGESEAYRNRLESILEHTYARGIGSWNKGEQVHLCHVVNAMVNITNRERFVEEHQPSLRIEELVN